MKQTKTRQTKSNSMIIHVGAGSDAYGKKILQDPDRIIRQDFLIGLQEWIFLCKIVVADFIQDSFVCVWACGCGRVQSRQKVKLAIGASRSRQDRGSWASSWC